MYQSLRPVREKVNVVVVVYVRWVIFICIIIFFGIYIYIWFEITFTCQDIYILHVDHYRNDKYHNIHVNCYKGLL